MYSIDEIVAAARKRGHTEEEVQRIIAQISDLKRAGFLKANSAGVALTAKGTRTVATLKAQGKIPSQ